MRNIYDVIRQKETEIQQLQKELEALRLAAQLLSDDTAKAEPEPVKSGRIGIPISPIKNDTEVILQTGPMRQFP